ncbi:hypothetical protein CC80DRAFT_394505, partial [Byssothecium circinans]
RDCAVCGEAIPVADFPSLANCTHAPETCCDCFAPWIEAELATKGWHNIRCPGTNCNILLQHHQVQAYATPKTFEQYDMFAMREALGNIPDFVWCTAPGCTSGQIHSDGNEGNIFRCVACGYRLCLIHKVKWHEGETCDEYTYRTSRRKQRDELARQNKASEAAIEKIAKKCPECTSPIEKDGG